jgi:hypothetical protein
MKKLDPTMAQQVAQAITVFQSQLTRLPTEPNLSSRRT